MKGEKRFYLIEKKNEATILWPSDETLILLKIEILIHVQPNQRQVLLVTIMLRLIIPLRVYWLPFPM